MKEENKSVNDVIDYFNQIEGNAANVVAMKLMSEFNCIQVMGMGIGISRISANS